MQEPDFAELSQYKSTQHGMPKYTSVPYTSNNFGMAEYTARGGGGYYEDTGFDDLTYDYINGSELARTVAKADENTLGLTEAGIGSDRLQRMTQDEISIYNYLYNKQGEEAADEFLTFIATDPNYTGGSLNAREREYEEQRMAEYAKEDPVGTSVASVMLSPYRGIAPAAGAIGDFLEDGRLERDAGYYSSINRTTAARSAVNEYITENYGSGWAYAYDQLMSISDNAMRGVLFGEGSGLALMAADAGASKVQSALDRGLDDSQAFALGIIAAIAEAFTEKFSLDQLFKKAEPGKSAFLRWLAQAGVEGSEEGASNIINTFFDVLIAGDESEWRTAVRNYESQGMSESKAFGQAVADKLGDIGMDVLGGMISGGIMGAPGAIYQGTINRRAGAAGSAEGTQQAGAAPVQQDSTAIDTDEDGHTPEERRVIEEYQGAVDPGLVDFYNAAQSDGNASGSYQLKDVSDRAAAEVKRILGRDVSGFRTVIDARQARHISNDHGVSGRSDRTMADANDVGRIQYVLDNFDTAEYGGRSGAYVERSANGRNRQAPTIKFSKKVDGTYFVIEAAPDTPSKTMYVVSAYMLGEGKTAPGRTNKMTGEASQSLDAEAPRRTSEIESENTSPVTDSVPQPGQNVNTEQARPAAVQAYDTARMVRAGAALGESGEKALNASYDPAIPADRYYRGFSEYYEAGVQGRSESDVKQDAFTSALNSAQRYAAYSAGRNDAAASLAREERAKNFAKTAGEDSGLVFDDYVSRELDEATANRINAAAKRLGTRVRFVEPGSIRGGTANAAISGAEVLIEKNNPNPVMFLLGHEWTHRMQELAPQEYRKFRQAAAGVEDVRLNAERTVELYRRQGVELTYEEALDEAAADYAGQMLDEDGAVLDRFIAEHRDDRTLLQRVRDAIRSLVNRLTGKERRGAESAVRKLDEALRAAERQAARLSENSGNARESGTRLSIKYDRNNTPYVVIEEDILAGVPRSEWVRTVKDNLRRKFPNGVVVGNNVIQIDGQSRGEMTFSKYMQRLMRSEPEMYADKLRSTNNADEILRAARNWTNEALLHPRADTIIDFARGEVLMRVGKRDYSAQVIVGNREGRGLLLYDIIGLTQTTIEEKRTSAVYTSVDPERSHGRQTAPAHGNSISENGEDVNRKFSLKEDSEGRELSAEQQEFFRDSKVRDEEGRLRLRTVCIFVCILYLKAGVNTFAISNVLSQRRR